MNRLKKKTINKGPIHYENNPRKSFAVGLRSLPRPAVPACNVPYAKDAAIVPDLAAKTLSGVPRSDIKLPSVSFQFGTQARPSFEEALPVRLATIQEVLIIICGRIFTSL